MSKENEFPCELTFKAVFRSGNVRDSIVSCLSEKELEHEISERPSGKGSFVSYTVTAHFHSEQLLNDVCCEIKGLPGFMTMF